MFGNIIFKEWFEANNKDKTKLTPLEQLTYVANRGMGALEYEPAKNIPKTSAINLEEIVSVLKQVIDQKSKLQKRSLIISRYSIFSKWVLLPVEPGLNF